MTDIYTPNPFIVDRFLCLSAGKVLSLYEPMVETSQWSDWDVESKFGLKFVFIAICHAINWDFLQDTLASRFQEDPDRLSAEFLMKVDARLIKKWLSDYPKPERIRASERAALIRDLGRNLNERFDGKPYNIILEANGRLTGETGLLELLNVFRAYSEDPVKKKSNVLAHDLIRERIVSFKDTDRIKPAVEYHIMRLYERTGRVVPRTPELQEALCQGTQFRPWFVKYMRNTVAEALSYTSAAAKLTVPDVNYVEWQIARSICLSEEPRCLRFKKAPDNLPQDIKRIFKGSCPYVDFCMAYSDPRLLKLREPKPLNTKAFY